MRSAGLRIPGTNGVSKMAENIVCIDSDGCAMDTMTPKHQQCFGPDLVDVFEIKERAAFLKYWDRLNLYSRTRGINRFKGLVTALEHIDYPHLTALKEWVATTPEFSEQALEVAIAKTQDDQNLKRALTWSKRVNQDIAAKSASFKAFTATKESLAAISKVARVAIVSSANKAAVLAEWKRNGLLEFVDTVFGQEDGKKAACLARLSREVPAHQIMMVGDAVGDYQASQQAGTLFFPILVTKENESWRALKENAFPAFVAGKYQPMQADYVAQFNANFDELAAR